MGTFSSIKWEERFYTRIYVSNQIALKCWYIHVRMAALYSCLCEMTFIHVVALNPVNLHMAWLYLSETRTRAR